MYADASLYGKLSCGSTVEQHAKEETRNAEQNMDGDVSEDFL